MILFEDKSKCCGCLACTHICPKQCITTFQDEEGFIYPAINEDVCINCGLCVNVCPVKNPHDHITPINVFGAINENEATRKNSSSGGVFSALYEEVIQRNGIVFGARFNEQWEVQHSFSDTIEAINDYRGSKYVQSNIGSCYKEVESFLRQGRLVLFSGTGCQISALQRYLRRSYENLLTVDVVCHGVPSPLVWKKYLNEVSISIVKKVNKKHHSGNHYFPLIEAISFRDKMHGWGNFGFSLKYDISQRCANGLNECSEVKKVFYEEKWKNPYLKGFLTNNTLRPSCYCCKSLSCCSSADITLADYWGAPKSRIDYSNDKGVSLIFVNTHKGSLFVDRITLKKETVDLASAIKSNPAYSKSVDIPKTRQLFFKGVALNKSIIALLNKYSHRPFRKRLEEYLKNILIHIGIFNACKSIYRAVLR